MHLHSFLKRMLNLIKIKRELSSSNKSERISVLSAKEKLFDYFFAFVSVLLFIYLSAPFFLFFYFYSLEYVRKKMFFYYHNKDLLNYRLDISKALML